MGSFSVWHWLIVLVVVLLIFGTKKLKNIGSDLGGAVKGFKQAMNEEQKQPTELPRNSEAGSSTIDVEVKDKEHN